MQTERWNLQTLKQELGIVLLPVSMTNKALWPVGKGHVPTWIALALDTKIYCRTFCMQLRLRPPQRRIPSCLYDPTQPRTRSIEISWNMNTPGTTNELLISSFGTAIKVNDVKPLHGSRLAREFWRGSAMHRSTTYLMNGDNGLPVLITSKTKMPFSDAYDCVRHLGSRALHWSGCVCWRLGYSSSSPRIL